MTSPSHQTLIETAVNHHLAGQLPQAEKIYRAVLQSDPNHPVALSLLGVIASHVGQHRQAVELLEKSIRIAPDNIDAYINLGNAFVELEQFYDGIASFNKALAINPNLAMIHANMCVPLTKLKRYEEARHSARKALELEPELIEAHNNIGNTYKEQETWQEAIAAFEAALAIDPHHIGTLNSMGNVYKDMERLDDAEAWYRKALELAPTHAEALNNLGIVCQEKGELEQAIALFEKALASRPTYAHAHNNMGIALQKQGNRQEAIACYRKALAAKPDFVDAVFNLSFSLLLEGQFKEGLEYYEWRWRGPKLKDHWRKFPQPVWDGTDLADKKILVWGEQGIGDEIVYASLYPELMKRAAACVLECEERLVPLYKRSFPDAQIVARKNPPAAETLAPDIDFHSPAASLMRWLLPSFAEGPDRENYLIADPSLTASLRAEYRTRPAQKVVGLGWWTENSKLNRSYNMPIEYFDNLLKTPNVTFVNLQYGDHTEQIEAVYKRTGVRIEQHQTIDPLASMDDFAALEKSMDLVISIVNSTAVLASGLGVPVWGLLPTHTEWRWGNDHDYCDWYPSMRLFRQSARGDWSAVENKLTRAFREWAAEPLKPSASPD